MRYRLHILATLLLVAIGVCPLAYGQEKRRKIKVQHVTFSGNETYPDTRLHRLMLTRPSAFLSRSWYYPEIFADDLDNVVAFYQQNGYLQAAVTDTQVVIDTLASTADIRIGISEGELTLVEGLTIFDNTVFPDSVLLEKVTLKPGEPFKRNLVQTGMVAMVSMYAELGYLDAAVSPTVKINPEANLALVDFTVTERQQATVGQIRIDGLLRTRPGVVTRELSLRPGDTVSFSELMDAQRRLYLTGLFESVFVRPVPARSGDSTQKDILIELKESLSSEFNVAVGFGSVDRVRGKTELVTRNLAGTARQVGSSIYASFIRRAITTSFTEPRTLGSRWRTDVNLLFEFLQEPGYDLSRFGTRLTVGRKLGVRSNLSLTYRFEDARLRHVETAEIPDNFDSRIRSLLVSISRDSRDNLFDPHRGTYLEWTNELAGAFLQGSNTFARSIFQGKWFHTLHRSTVLATAFEIGWMDYFGGSGSIPLNERFYTGGPSSIRSFRYQAAGPLDADGDPLGGRFKLVWNVAELRRSLYRMIGCVVFVDAGNVWRDVSDFKVSDMRMALGVGLRASTPIGILRIDYAVNPDHRGSEATNRLYFNMGHTF